MTRRVAFQCTPNKVLIGLALGFLPLLVALGFWQLQRAEEKRVLLAEQREQLAKPPLSWADIGREDVALAHRRLAVQGVYDLQRYWLLENQIWQGRIGYRVIMPFMTDFGGILVDRGWVPMSRSGYRKDIPEILIEDLNRLSADIGKSLSIHGRLSRFSDHTLLENRYESAAWPRWILEVNARLLVDELEDDSATMQPLVLKLDPDSVSAFTVPPQSVNMPPRKHVGYAVQWFGLAIALVILSLFANTNLGAWIRSRKSADIDASHD